jgi:hypothetical protein
MRNKLTQKPKSKRMEGSTLILALILIGFAAGVFGGLVGIGGGVIIVPALMFIAGFTQMKAQGTSLGMLLLPVGILGAYQYYKSGNIEPWNVLYLAAGFVAGSFLGSKVALALPPDVTRKIFAGLMLFMAVKMFFEKPAPKKENSSNTPTSTTQIPQ